MSHSDEDDNIEYELVSKSQMKREMHEVQALGKKLLELRPDQLATVPMTERLAAAVEESRRITKNEARRRHLQFIGKLMRDNDVEAIQKALDRLDSSSELFQREMHQAEAWRERLIRDPNAEVVWFEQHPNTEPQPFRALIRAARKEQPEDPAEPIRGGKNSKKLLKWVREALKD